MILFASYNTPYLFAISFVLFDGPFRNFSAYLRSHASPVLLMHILTIMIP